MGNTAQTISPTSGETEFNPQIDEIIEEAFERTGVKSAQNRISIKISKKIFKHNVSRMG